MVFNREDQTVQFIVGTEGAYDGASPLDFKDQHSIKYMEV